MPCRIIRIPTSTDGTLAYIPVAIKKVIPYFTFGWSSAIFAITAYPIIGGMRTKSMTTPRSFRRSESKEVMAVIMEANA
jgi:hypothetical protein